MYMIWHKRLGAIKLYPFILQAIVWCIKHGRDNDIVICRSGKAI